MSGLVEADGSKGLNKFYHKSFFLLALLTPVSFALAPSPMNQPVDIALGVLFPVHAHVGLNYVITDYVPKAFRTAARVSLLGVTGLTIAGLLQLNLSGVGMTGTIKNLWKGKKVEAKH